MIDCALNTGRDDSSSIARVLAFHRATPADRRTGFLGTVRCVFAGGLVVEVAVRRTACGRLTLSFPASRTRSGRRRHLAHPIDDDARVAIERAVFDQLDLDEEGTP